MNHPFFDARRFPWHREEAKALHRALCDVEQRPQRILGIVAACGGDTSELTPGSPSDLWRDALDHLTSAHKIEALCDHLTSDPSYAAARAVIDAVRSAKPDPHPEPTKPDGTNFPSAPVGPSTTVELHAGDGVVRAHIRAGETLIVRARVARGAESLSLVISGRPAVSVTQDAYADEGEAERLFVAHVSWEKLAFASLASKTIVVSSRSPEARDGEPTGNTIESPVATIELIRAEQRTAARVALFSLAVPAVASIALVSQELAESTTIKRVIDATPTLLAAMGLVGLAPPVKERVFPWLGHKLGPTLALPLLCAALLLGSRYAIVRVHNGSDEAIEPARIPAKGRILATRFEIERIQRGLASISGHQFKLVDVTEQGAACERRFALPGFWDRWFVSRVVADVGRYRALATDERRRLAVDAASCAPGDRWGSAAGLCCVDMQAPPDKPPRLAEGMRWVQSDASVPTHESCGGATTALFRVLREGAVERPLPTLSARCITAPRGTSLRSVRVFSAPGAQTEPNNDALALVQRDAQQPGIVLPLWPEARVAIVELEESGQTSEVTFAVEAKNFELVRVVGDWLRTVREPRTNRAFSVRRPSGWVAIPERERSDTQLAVELACPPGSVCVGSVSQDSRFQVPRGVEALSVELPGDRSQRRLGVASCSRRSASIRAFELLPVALDEGSALAPNDQLFVRDTLAWTSEASSSLGFVCLATDAGPVRPTIARLEAEQIAVSRAVTVPRPTVPVVAPINVAPTPTPTPTIRRTAPMALSFRQGSNVWRAPLPTAQQRLRLGLQR